MEIGTLIIATSFSAKGIVKKIKIFRINFRRISYWICVLGLVSALLSSILLCRKSCICFIISTLIIIENKRENASCKDWSKWPGKHKDDFVVRYVWVHPNFMSPKCLLPPKIGFAVAAITLGWFGPTIHCIGQF